MTTSREIHLVKRPDGMPRDADFALREVTLPEPADGQALVQNLYLSVDPATRPRLTRGQDVNAVLGGFALGRVVKSRAPNLKEGDVVRGAYGYRERYVADAKHLAKVDADPKLPLTVYMHVMGGAGFVAYGGLLEIGKMKIPANRCSSPQPPALSARSLRRSPSSRAAPSSEARDPMTRSHG